jgi:hypothetical protein
MTKLIALYSPYPGCGKTTVAEHLCFRHGFTRIGFAAPLRAMVQALLEYAGHHEDTAAYLIRACKEEPTALPYNVTVRHMMRTLGTEWGRTCMGPDFWVDLWRMRVDAAWSAGQRVVCDDMRYPNELAMVQRLDGEAWRITRPAIQPLPDADGHASDGALEQPKQLWHHYIRNDGTVEMLLQYVDECLKMEVVG